MPKGTILLAAGGTGGHLFPAEALAYEMVARGWKVHLATDDRAERFAAHFPAAAVHPIASATFGSRNPITLARSFWTIWRGVRQASEVIRRIKPEVAVGFGGYPTVPPLYAANRRGVPVIVHEQNAVMGRANRALAAKAVAIAGGFLPAGQGRYGAKTIVTGNPVRPPVLQAAATPYVPSHDGEPFRLLVFGGSQGARAFNESVPAALAGLRVLIDGFEVRHQCGEKQVDSAARAYADAGIEASIEPFIADMAAVYGWADVVVCRAGALTLAELCAVGVGSVLVPFPQAVDDHQTRNAEYLVDRGAAQLLPQGADTRELAQRLSATLEILAERVDLLRMAQAARALARPDAAARVAGIVSRLASHPKSPDQEQAA